ncbi:MAG: hypothetical protein NDJ90_15685 [Oligoflexia bacterium]|nr:hypothetical protein [Oligoflexia bacterium]
MPFRLLFVGLLCALGGAVASAPARADFVDAGNYKIYIWPKWQEGFDIGPRAIGRFGRGSNINSPSGDILMQASYHAWYQHMIDIHALVGYGVSNSTFAFGGGVRVNLLELIEDPTSEMFIRGLQRGLLAPILKNFMVFLSLEMIHYNFPRPAGSDRMALTFSTSAWEVMPGAGAQWYFYVPQRFAGRFYFETAISYMRVELSHYFSPYFGIGAELL